MIQTHGLGDGDPLTATWSRLPRPLRYTAGHARCAPGRTVPVPQCALLREKAPPPPMSPDPSRARDGHQAAGVAWAAGPLPGHRLARAGPLPGHRLARAGPLPGHRLARAGPLPGHRLARAGPLPGHRLARAGPLPGGRLARPAGANRSSRYAPTTAPRPGQKPSSTRCSACSD